MYVHVYVSCMCVCDILNVLSSFCTFPAPTPLCSKNCIFPDSSKRAANTVSNDVDIINSKPCHNIICTLLHKMTIFHRDKENNITRRNHFYIAYTGQAEEKNVEQMRQKSPTNLMEPCPPCPFNPNTTRPARSLLF